MKTLHGRNVNELYARGLALLASEGAGEDTRNGRAAVMPCPVVSVYEKPMERVLFDVRRDANPFFHLMEGLWMLAGRNDPEFLDRYISDFGSRYADNGTIHGAYGHRWREALGYDQLDVIVDKLRANPNDRQCVLQMWDAHDQEISTYDSRNDCEGDTAKIGADDLCGTWKDRPCNTQVFFRVRKQETDESSSLVLDMTILCRSNDVVWGAYGANAVHFSMMMEYMAGRIGVDVGTMYQFSNNYHGYLETLDKVAPEGAASWMILRDLYTTGGVEPTPMGLNWSMWDQDLATFMRWHDDALWKGNGDIDEPSFTNDWFIYVAVPVARANYARRQGDLVLALQEADSILADDWHLACYEWLERRITK